MDPIIPSEVRIAEAGATLRLVYGGGEVFALPAEYLRVMTPSAEARGHHGVGGQTVSGKKNVRLLETQKVGNYALRLVYDDGHRTGLYTWEYLRELSLGREEKWRAYLDELLAGGLSR